MANPAATQPLVSALALPRRAGATRPSPAADFYVGPENRLTAGAVTEWITAAEAGSETVLTSLGPSVLTLLGAPGVGKSMLARGVATAWVQTHGEGAVLVVTGVDLRRQLERAISRERSRPGSVAAIAQRLEQPRLLVVEDLAGLAPSDVTVDRLVQLLEAAERSGQRVLLTASRPLGEIAGLTARLVSRLAGGLIVEITGPAVATRAKLLASAIQAQGGSIDSNAADLIATATAADGRAVLATAEALRRRKPTARAITKQDAEAFLEALRDGSTSIPLIDIAAVVARYYRMPLRQLRSSSRKAPVVLARAMTIYLARELTPLSYDEIGQYLGGRDHSTVMHNFRRIEGRLPTDRALRSALDDLRRLTSGGEASR